MSTSEPIDVDGREARYDSSEEHRNSNRGWAGNIDLQLWGIPPSSSHRASKQKASTRWVLGVEHEESLTQLPVPTLTIPLRQTSRVR